MHSSLNKRILKFSLTFDDLNIDLSWANAAHASPIRTYASRSVDPAKDLRHLKSPTMLIGLPFMGSRSVGDKLDDGFSRICSLF